MGSCEYQRPILAWFVLGDEGGRCASMMVSIHGIEALTMGLPAGRRRMPAWFGVAVVVERVDGRRLSRKELAASSSPQQSPICRYVPMGDRCAEDEAA